MPKAAAGGKDPWSGTGPVNGLDLTNKTQRVFKWTAQELHPDVIKYSTTLYFLNKVLPRYLFHDMKRLISKGVGSPKKGVGWKPQDPVWLKHFESLFSPEPAPLKAVNHATAAGYLNAVNRPTFGKDESTANPYFSKDRAFKLALKTVVETQKEIESSALDYAFDPDLNTAIATIRTACSIPIANSLGIHKEAFLKELDQLSTFVP